MDLNNSINGDSSRSGYYCNITNKSNNCNYINDSNNFINGDWIDRMQQNIYKTKSITSALIIGQIEIRKFDSFLLNYIYQLPF